MARTTRIVLAHAGLVGLIALAFAALPAEVGRVIVPGATALAAAAAVLIGMRRYRPVREAYESWAQIAGGLVTIAIGNVLTGIDRLGLRSDAHPSISDAIMLIAYLMFLGGILGLLRMRVAGKKRRAGLLDAILGATAASLLAWTFLVEPTVAVTDASVAGVLTGIAYPLLSLVLLAVAAPLWFAVHGTASASFRIVVLAMLVLVSTNVAFGFAILANLPPPTPGVEASISFGWIAFFLLIGLAALQPSMSSSPEAAGDDVLPSWRRFAALVVVCGTTPLIVIFSGDGAIDGADLAALTVGMLVILATTLLRMSDIQSELRGSLKRERTLRAANDDLVAAVDLAQVRSVLTGATRALLGDTARIWLVEDPRLAGYRPPEGRPETVHVLTGPQDLRITLAAPENVPLVVAELPAQTDLSLALVGATPKPPGRETLDALDALVQCAALAIDRVSLGAQVLERQSEARIQRLLQNASDVVAVLDRRLVVRYVTPAVERMLEHRPRDVIGSRWLDHVKHEDRERAEEMIRSSNEGWPSRGEIRLTTRDGSVRYAEVAVSRVAESDGGGFTLACHDITVRHDLEKQLTHQAFHDTLTGLANRALFQNRLRHVVERMRRNGERFAVLFIDVDDFKTVNDSLGHAAGDTLLRTFALRLESSLRKEDTAARLGGDEFAVILEDVLTDEDLHETVDRLLAVLSEPVEILGAEVPIGASIGIAIGGSSTDAPSELMRNADLALYEAKGAGKGRAAVFAPSMHADAVDHLQMKAEMRRGLNQGEFIVQYQPFFTLDAEARIVGVEALVRWNHPTRGLLAPGEFVHLAEETGLVVALGQRVLREALAAAARWHALPGRESLVVAVNLSGRQLCDDDAIEDVRAAIQDSGVDPSRVVLEITESILLPDGGVTVERLRQLRALGVRIYVDDFGTGYSSLAYLRDLPVSGIKLAREFVMVLPGTEGESGLVRTIGDLSRTLGLDYVVAEGVETEEQRQALIALGYTVGQGFHLARPTDADGIHDLLVTTSDRTELVVR